MRKIGTVATFNHLTGTGFLKPEGGGETIPFRQVDVEREGDDELAELTRLSFEIELDDQGEMQAIHLRFA